MFVKFKAIIGILWKAGLFGFIGYVIDNRALSRVALLALLVLFDPMTWQSFGYLFGNLYILISNRFKLPSKETYTCKGGYILPFTGKWTVINGGVTRGLSHSYGHFSQRYAYDFVILDDDAQSLNGGNTDVSSYYCYGKDVIAPADGVVVKVGTGHKDSRVTRTKVFCDTWDLRGNHTVIRHANREYSVICHLMPGSVRVQKGDAVKQGQVIARCGNTGNTSEPHVHFQLQNGRSFFLSAGLPIAFSNIRAQSNKNYGLLDTRDCVDNLIPCGDKVYIGRGLEVENVLTYPE